MKNHKSIIRQYLRTVSSYLPCSHRVKKHILNEIEGNMNAYFEENPEANYNQIEVRFGSPQGIAAAYVDDMDTQELLRTLLIRKKVKTAIIGCLFSIVLLWAIGVSYIMIHEVTHFPGTVYIDSGELASDSEGTDPYIPESE